LPGWAVSSQRACYLGWSWEATTEHRFPKRAEVRQTTDLLVIEDNPNLRRALAEALLSEGYQVISAADGVDALRALDQADPWLILMERRLPRMDAKEFLHELRQRRMRARIVIFTGARDAAQTVEELMADGYLVKPFDLSDLFALVERYCPKQD
jgi:two-component system, OmpR family, response regulator MprA